MRAIRCWGAAGSNDRGPHNCKSRPPGQSIFSGKSSFAKLLGRQRSFHGGNLMLVVSRLVLWVSLILPFVYFIPSAICHGQEKAAEEEKAQAEEPKVDPQLAAQLATPRDTMRTFLDAINNKDRALAAQCLATAGFQQSRQRFFGSRQSHDTDCFASISNGQCGCW